MTRRMCFGMIAVAVVASVLGGIAGAVLVRPAPVDAQTGVYVAREFRLVGPDGSLRGRYWVSPDGLASMALFDGNVRVRAALYVPADGRLPQVAITNAQGAPVVIATHGDNGVGFVVTYDAYGNWMWATP